MNSSNKCHKVSYYSKSVYQYTLQYTETPIVIYLYVPGESACKLKSFDLEGDM